MAGVNLALPIVTKVVAKWLCSHIFQSISQLVLANRIRFVNHLHATSTDKE